ncbi:MAG: nucleotide exchange factor GrpE [Muribaculaceae bacterium]|nr:nucleotide exchange factor GrpE [Muribaculaceae bacterium]
MSVKDKKVEAQEANNEAQNNINIENPQVEINDTADVENSDVEDFANEEMSEIDELKQKLASARVELEKEKKEYLFLMAEFDNFRKRVVKEKAELIKNAAEKVLAGLLPIIDDFERGLNATKDSEDAAATHQGMELIYNKLIKYLKDNGVVEMETQNVMFDPEIHEAIAMVPATDPEQKGKIVDTVQKGYMLNDKVLRHAKVAVAQ